MPTEPPPPTAPVPRMRADARRNRARVLAAAQAAFASDGLLVPLDEIARRAGVGAGTVYRHFPTKEALFEAVILHRVQGLADRAKALEDADPPGEALFAFVAHLTREGTAKKDLVDALGGAPLPNVAEVNRDLWASLAELLGRAQRAGEVRADVGIADVRALLRGAFVATSEENDPALTDRVVAVVCDGLRGRA